MCQCSIRPLRVCPQHATQMPAQYNALYADLLDLDATNETVVDVPPAETEVPTLDFATITNYVIDDNGRQDLCLRPPPPMTEPPAPVPVPAPVPTIPDAANAKEIVPGRRLVPVVVTLY